MNDLPARVQLPTITPVALAQLAREVAQDISELPDILRKHGLTPEQYQFLEAHNAYFKSVLENEIKSWQGIKSTEARIRLQAQAAIEMQLPTLATRMGSTAEKLGDAVEAFKAISKVAGVDNAPASAGVPGEKFTINIDLGAGTRVVIGAQTELKDVTPERPLLEQS